MKFYYPDKAVISDLQSTDEKNNNRAFRYLYKKYYPIALAFVRGNRGDEEETQDVFQESLIAFYESIKNNKFRGDSAIKTYLYSIIRNTWFSRLKKNKLFVNIDDAESEISKLEYESAIDYDQVRSFLIKKLFERLGKACQDILQYYYFHKLSMKEIMKKMNFSSEQSAKTQKYKCMQKLLKLIENKPDIKQSLIDLL